MKNVLITRNRNQAQEIAQVFENAGFKSFIEPLFSVVKITPKKIKAKIKASIKAGITKKNIKKNTGQKISAIIITSANSCQALIDFSLLQKVKLQKVKIFCVGKKTAQKLAGLDFKNIILAPQNSALSLHNLIVKTHCNKSGLIIYFHGSVITLDFQKSLKKYGFAVEKVLAYKTCEAESFSAEFLKFCEENFFDHILLFSRNSAGIFLKLSAQHNLLEYFRRSQILCLSSKILDEVKKYGFSNSAIFNQFPILKNFYDQEFE
jgi:uroporphyrinogen-III synthase